MSDLGWAVSLCWMCGVMILVCCAIVLWPRKPRGLAKPVHDSRSSLEVWNRIRGQL